MRSPAPLHGSLPCLSATCQFMKHSLLALLPIAVLSAERDPQTYTFTAGDYHIQMEVRFLEPYVGKRLVFYNSTNPGKEICVYPSGKSLVCPERFVGAVATVTLAVMPPTGDSVNEATIREAVTVLSQSSALPARPRFEKAQPATGGVISDVQVFGYDETEIPEKQRAAERRARRRLWRVYRQELYLNGDRDPFVVIQWRHTLDRVELVHIQRR